MATTTYKSLPVTTLAHGGALSLPLHEIRGAADGPTFGISACIHGDEQVSTEIIYRFIQGFDASQLRGRILIMPVANPLAYEAISRNTPLDMTNMNRVFPGDRGGWLTEQMALVMTEHFLSQVDILLDFHAGGAFATVDYIYITNAEELSRAFGSPLLYRPDPAFQGTLYAGTSQSSIRERGARAVTVELGGGAVDQGTYVERGVCGIYNVLKESGMLPGEPAPRPAQTVMREIAIIRPTQGGMLVPAFTAMNAEVPGGTVLGQVVSPYSFEVLETIRSPFDRGITVLLRPTVTKVQPGDYAYMVGNLENAEPQG